MTSFIELENNLSTKVVLSSVGASIYDIQTKDKNGKVESIIYTTKEKDDFSTERCMLGKTIGRTGGRISNSKFSLNGVDYKIPSYDPNGLHGGIDGISYNSLLTKPKDIFLCIRGEATDGHNYAKSAVEKGAVALFCEEELDLNVPQIIVKDTKRTMAKIAAAFYMQPSKDINLIGVTGTNGKTTVTHLVQKILEENNEKCALIGTLGYKFSSSDEYKEAKHTTPQPPELQRDLRLMADKTSLHDLPS